MIIIAAYMNLLEPTGNRTLVCNTVATWMFATSINTEHIFRLGIFLYVLELFGPPEKQLKHFVLGFIIHANL